MERSLAILDRLAGQRAGLRLVEIAEAVGCDRASALRILTAMEEHGFIFRDPLSERYRLTFRVTALGFRHLEAAGVTQWAQPILDDLAAETRELVRLAAAERDTLRWIGRAQGAASTIIVDPAQGKAVPLHATAAGKAWLALLPEDDAIELVLRQGFHPQTTRTIRTLPELRAELRRTRERGYGTANEEADDGVLAIAVAIVSDGRPVGTVSVAAPTARATLATLERWLPQLRRAADQLAVTWGPYVAELIPEPVTRASRPGRERR
ncbi:MAG: IclR family transcriptional regulator [Chloroflexi bacterium]|nr:IclR family transcriptional regulator [Chloroflexota bacterium]GIW10859.1 MAG: IclR family transcriptional regulator [Dehalococcoidia bacterium]